MKYEKFIYKIVAENPQVRGYLGDLDLGFRAL
jgi:hypothetical protein